jgi:hypothetical protein
VKGVLQAAVQPLHHPVGLGVLGTAVVGWCLICNKRHSEFQILEVSCSPLSDVMMAGTPNLQIHPENNAAATSATAVLARGSASIQQLVLFITVKM